MLEFMCLKLLYRKINYASAVLEVLQVVAAVLDIPVEPTMGESFVGGILVNAFLARTSWDCLTGGHNGGVRTPGSMLF